jgi:hypothetical protein
MKYACNIAAGKSECRALAQTVSRQSGLALESVHVGFVVDKVAMGQVSVQLLRFSPIIVIPPGLRTRLSFVG